MWTDEGAQRASRHNNELGAFHPESQLQSHYVSTFSGANSIQVIANPTYQPPRLLHYQQQDLRTSIFYDLLPARSPSRKLPFPSSPIHHAITMTDADNLSPTTAVEVAAAIEIDVSTAPSTTGTATLADDVAMAASSLAATSAPGTGTATPNPGTGTVTPFVELDDRQRRMSLNVSLADLSARATALYALKNYEEAAGIYAQAAEMQAEMNGEMSPENAEILFLYGRTLFKVGQSKSDVLGGKAPAAGDEGAKKSKKGKKTTSSTAADDAGEGSSAEKTIEEKVATIAEEATETKKTEESAEKKPLFQFTGDENFDESDEEVGQSPRLGYNYLLTGLLAGCRGRGSRGRGRRG